MSMSMWFLIAAGVALLTAAIIVRYGIEHGSSMGVLIIVIVILAGACWLVENSFELAKLEKTKPQPAVVEPADIHPAE